MDEVRNIVVDGKEYQVSLKRFDDVVNDENGEAYHGFYITIDGLAKPVTARKYDDENAMNVESGVEESDTTSIAAIRGIARQLFNTNTLALFVAGDPPYKEI